MFCVPSFPALITVYVRVCVCVHRPAAHHGRLPGHGGGRPAVREHCGVGGLLLGGEPDAARLWAALPHGR